MSETDRPNSLSPALANNTSKLLASSCARVQRLRRLPVGTYALGGERLEVQLAGYSKNVPSDHNIQTLHAMQGKKTRQKVLISSTSIRYTKMSTRMLDANCICC